MLAYEFTDIIHSEKLKIFKGGNVVFPTDKVYDVKVLINIKKIQDVAKVVHYVPDEYTDFYTNILSLPTPTTHPEEEENYDSD